MVIRFDRMMSDFDGLMEDIISFIDYSPSSKLIDEISLTAETQRTYVSKHKYNLDRFGITEEQIRQDCKKIYSLLNGE